MAYQNREQLILEMIAADEQLSVHSLARRLFVSEATLRRDLGKMESKGLVTRTHGGVTLRSKPANERIPQSLRAEEHAEEKRLIAQQAASLIRDGDVIMLDPSTTTDYILPYLEGHHNNIVITNCVRKSLQLGRMGITNFLAGGQMLNESFCLVGRSTETMVESMNADIVFFSCRGITEDGMLTDTSIDADVIRRAMLSQARRRVLLLDHSKLGKNYLHNFCHLSELTDVFCDIPLPEKYAAMLRK